MLKRVVFQIAFFIYKAQERTLLPLLFYLVSGTENLSENEKITFKSSSKRNLCNYYCVELVFSLILRSLELFEVISITN